MRRAFIMRLLAYGTALLASVPALGAAPMVYTYNAPENILDQRYRYHVEVLRSALEATQERFGPYLLQPSRPMTEERQVQELATNSGTINVVIRGANQDYARQLLCVPIAIDKGILGYRVLLIRAQDQPLFSRVSTLQDLQAFSVGQGKGWKDVDILRANGLRVVTGSNYAGLFQMLRLGRFAAFSRGIEEVLDEYGAFKEQVPDMVIESSLLLYYPMPRYFWFNRQEAGQALAHRVSVGMQTIIGNGTLDAREQASSGADAATGVLYGREGWARTFTLQRAAARPAPGGRGHQAW